MPRRKRISPLPLDEGPTEPFLDSAEAWFWFARCTLLRRDGARLKRDQDRMRRPCEPDDIYRIVMSLRQQGLLEDRHLKVLAKYGSLLRPPVQDSDSDCAHALLWETALDRMTTPLAQKGIILPREPSEQGFGRDSGWP